MQKSPDKVDGQDGLPLPPHKVYNIGNNHPENLIDFVSILQQELINENILPKNYNFEKYTELVAMQPGDIAITYADTSELEADFDFKPNTSLRDGLNRFIKWYREFYL